MSDTKDLDLTYTGIAVHGPDLAVLTTARGDVEDDEEVDHELVYIFEQGEWTVYDAKDRNIVAATFDQSGDEIALLSPDGKVLRLLPKSTQREEIDPSDEGPSDLVEMKFMRRLDDLEVVVGMARRVYARRGGAGWAAIDQGCHVPRAQRSAAIGFNGVDGWGSQRLVAVGYKGEIWMREGERWSQLDSPTNVTLMSVATAPGSRTFVAVGLAGVVIAGSPGALRLIDTEQTPGAFWSVVHFAGSFFMAGDEGVFRLDGPNFDTLLPVKLTSRGTPPSTAYLAAAPQSLWSVGDEDIFTTQDGVKWKRVPGP